MGNPAVVRKVTITKPKHNTRTSETSKGHNHAAKISRNSRKKFRKRELRRVFASINKAFLETGARLDAELIAILSDNDSVFETVSNIPDKAEDGTNTAESVILCSAATPLCCSTRSKLKKTGGSLTGSSKYQADTWQRQERKEDGPVICGRQQT